VSASDDDDSVCDRLKGTLTRTASVGQGHHFGGDYTRLVELILK
jgi:type IV secretory pathway VirJ component